MRLQKGDFIDPFEETYHSFENASLCLPPINRRTIQRALTDSLVLLPVKNTVDPFSSHIELPSTQRLPNESLRMSIERLIDELALNNYTFIYSNAPQACILSHQNDKIEEKNFVFVASLVNHFSNDR